jgi:hypothetical protein
MMERKGEGESVTQTTGGGVALECFYRGRQNEPSFAT